MCPRLQPTVPLGVYLGHTQQTQANHWDGLPYDDSSVPHGAARGLCATTQHQHLTALTLQNSADLASTFLDSALCNTLQHYSVVLHCMPRCKLLAGTHFVGYCKTSGLSSTKCTSDCALYTVANSLLEHMLHATILMISYH